MFVSRRRAAVAGAVLTLAAAVSACSSTSSGGGQAAISPSTAASEFLAEESHVHLAPGWTWPSKVAFPDAGPDGKPMLYQFGYGTTQADHYWYCSWEETLVAPKISKASALAARHRLAEVRQTHMYIADVLPVDRPYFNKVLDTALRGDTRLMQRDVGLNCAKGSTPSASASSAAG